MLKLGPILKFLGCENDEWRLGEMAVTVDADLSLALSFFGNLLAKKFQQLLSFIKINYVIFGMQCAAFI